MMTKKFLTLQEASDYVGIAEKEFKDLVDIGKVPSYKIGGIYTRFRVDDLEAYRRKISVTSGKKMSFIFADRLKDFFYFNDFYILSFVSILAILYLIFK